MNHQNNIERVKTVFNALGELQNRVVFVGGATVSFYADRQTFEVRETDDVDVIIELLSYSSHVEFEEKLRNLGFSHDVESGVLCRYRIQGVIVDIMPTTDGTIGFSNKWYPDGFNEAIHYKIDERQIVKILSSPYFIATKLEAFKSRGLGDGRTSQDFEDIVYILENRSSIWQEMQSAQAVLKEYLYSDFKQLMDSSNITEWIDCHVERGSPPATYLILEEIEQFIKTR